MSREYVYRVPLPLRGLGQNARGHWTGKSRATKAYRIEVVQAVLREPRPEQPLARAEVRVEARICRKRPNQNPGTVDAFHDWVAFRDRYRPIDADNLLAACKPLLDALQPPRGGTLGASIILDDTAEHIMLHPVTMTRVDTFAEEGIIITVTEIEEGVDDD